VEVFLQLYGTFFEEFRYEGLSSCLFYIIFITRRYTIGFIIMFIPHPTLQLSLSAVFSISVIFKKVAIYLYATKIYINRLQGSYIIINELLTFAFYSIISLSFILDLSISNKTLSFVCIMIVTISLGINIIISIGQTGIIVYNYFKRIKISNFDQTRMKINIINSPESADMYVDEISNPNLSVRSSMHNNSFIDEDLD
jgi:hypothetical protein